MKLLTWTLGILGAYVATIYVLQKPRTWATIALVSERISYGARDAYNTLKRQEQEMAGATRGVRHAKDCPDCQPSPPIGRDDGVDAVRFAISWLREQYRR